MSEPRLLANEYFQVKPHGDVTVIIPSPEVEQLPDNLVQPAADMVLAPLRESESTNLFIIIDLSGVRYFGSAFITFLLRCHLLVKKRGSELVAGAFNLRGQDALYGRYWGAHVEVPFLHFNVCYYHTVERAITERIALFEPGAGGEHKTVRGFHPTITHSVHLFSDPRFALAIADFFDREREAIESELAPAESGG